MRRGRRRRRWSWEKCQLGTYYCEFASEAYTTPKLMRAQTAILFLSDSVRFHTTAMGSSVQTTSAKTETALEIVSEGL